MNELSRNADSKKTHVLNHEQAFKSISNQILNIPTRKKIALFYSFQFQKNTIQT